MGLTGDLCSDIIGTNPKYPPIVDHNWLNVDLSKYDNYPSDNNPVRVVPKLNDLWSHSSAQTGVNLVPNATVMPLGVRSSEEDVRSVDQIVKEAKKAIMAGLKGRKLSEHLRVRFSPKCIAMAQEALKKVADEIGLLGNVYIDASAFNSYDDAEKFLSDHRVRLARDILMNTEGINPSVVTMLANKFHKNIVSSVEYNEDLFNKYKDFLVQAGRISKDTVIASKEDLRKAFLYEKPQEIVKNPTVKENRLSGEQVIAAVTQMFEKQAVNNRDVQDSVMLSKISPIVSFVQKNLANGKTSAAIKEMVKSKYSMVDVKDAAEALVVVLSKEGLTEANIDNAINSGKISSVIGNELKRIGKEFPVKVARKFEGAVEVPYSAGVKGYFYPLDGKKAEDKNGELCRASVEAMKKGVELERIYNKLFEKLSNWEEVNLVLADAMREFNNLPAGRVANRPVKQSKIIVEEPSPKQVLPDPSTIASQLDELNSIFEGSRQMAVNIDSARDVKALEVGEIFNRQGIDSQIT